MSFTIATPGRVSLKVFDLQGREVRNLMDQDAAAGEFALRWDGIANAGARVGKGVYFARLVTPGGMTEQKLVLQ